MTERILAAATAALLLLGAAAEAWAQEVLSSSYGPLVMLSTETAVAVRALGDHAGEVVLTQDGGETWRATADLGALGVGRAEALCFGTSRVGILVGREGTVLRTADGGRSWRRHGRAPGGEARGCQLFGGSRGYLVAGGRLLFTHDGGRRWTVAAALGEATDACFSDSLRGLLATDGGLYRTASGGRAWQEVLARPGIRSVTCVGRRRAWIGTVEGRVHSSEDGGASWSRGVEAGLAGVEWLRFASERIGFALGSDGDAARTTDGGRSWNPMELPSGGDRPSFLTAALGYCSGSALHVTDDRGESWATRDVEYAPAPETPLAEGPAEAAPTPGEEGEGSEEAEASDEVPEEDDAIYVDFGGRRIRVPRRR